MYLIVIILKAVRFLKGLDAVFVKCFGVRLTLEAKTKRRLTIICVGGNEVDPCLFLGKRFL